MKRDEFIGKSIYIGIILFFAILTFLYLFLAIKLHTAKAYMGVVVHLAICLYFIYTYKRLLKMP